MSQPDRQVPSSVVITKSVQDYMRLVATEIVDDEITTHKRDALFERMTDKEKDDVNFLTEVVFEVYL